MYTYFPICLTEVCSSFRSKLLISSISRKEESSSSVVSPAPPRAFSLASCLWTSSRVLLPPGTPPTDANAGPMITAIGSWFATADRKKYHSINSRTWSRFGLQDYVVCRFNIGLVNHGTSCALPHCISITLQYSIT